MNRSSIPFLALCFALASIGCTSEQPPSHPGEAIGVNTGIPQASSSGQLNAGQKPKLRSIIVSPSSTSLPVGRTLQFTAWGIYKDGSTVELTDSVTWTSSNTSIATVSDTGLGTGVAVGGPVTVTATLDKMSGTSRLIVTEAVLSSIAITPAAASVPAGMAQPFTVRGIYSNGTTIDVTHSVTWTSSNTSIATVDETGLGAGVAVGGPVTLTATLGSVSGTSQLTVTAAVLTSLAVTPAAASVPAGMTQPFTANGSYSDGTTVDLTNNVTWTSSDTALATLSDMGLGIGAAAGGPVTVTATLGSVSGTSQLTVTAAVLTSLAVTPATAVVPAGMTQSFTANGSYSDGTTVDLTNNVTWTSSDTALATVDGMGQGIGVAAGGPVSVTAMLDNVSGTSQLTVTEAVLTSIVVTSAAASMPAGMTLSFTASGSYSNGTTRDITNSVMWTSSNTSIATVNDLGLGTGVAAGGPVTVTAMLGGVSGTSHVTVTEAVLTSIAVTPATASVPVGMTQPFTASGRYSDGTTLDVTDRVTWTSSDTSIATVSGTGLGTGMEVGGPVTLTATAGSVSGTSQFTVTHAVLTSLEVTPATASVPAGVTQPFTAQGRYSDGTRMDVTNSVTWTSSNTLIARVSGTGLGTGVAADGTATLTATLGNVSGTSQLTVTAARLNAIWIFPETARILIGRPQQFFAHGGYSNGSMVNITNKVTWTSSNTSVATVSSTGVVMGVSAGVWPVILTATLDGVSATSRITVTPWSSAGAMSSGRNGHTATLLSSGKVLVTGGSSSSGTLATAEVYDLATNAWSPAGSMASARKGHTATLLPSGQVLVMGGSNGNGPLATMELYDPTSNTWSPAGAMASDRRNYTVTVLPSGKVLFVGGSNGSTSYLATAEVYDPATHTWSPAGSMASGRSDHAVTLLSSGKVLVTGGFSGWAVLTTAEVYDPETNTWSPAGSMSSIRHIHSATLLSSGKVLVAGSANGGGSNPLATAEVYDPATNTWSPAAPMALGRYGQSATLLSSGKVLVTGGFMGSAPTATAEVYDPATNSWTSGGSMLWNRLGHTATLLSSGQVLLLGGYSNYGGVLRDAELYTP
jgi:uncharacterized protein YjdB